MKSAVLERMLKNYPAALKILSDAIELFPSYSKLWVIKGQILDEDLSEVDKAREHYSLAVRKIPKSTLLWILASKLEEKMGVAIKARALLEKARLLNPKTPELWVEAVQVERRSGNIAMAKALLAKALQDCPKSGALWCENIMMEARPQRKARSTDALKNCENDPLVVTTIARLFWFERKIDKARNWFDRACKTDPDMGDSWAWWYKFELAFGSKEQQEHVFNRCVAAEPRHGIEWPQESKKIINIGKKPGEILRLVAAKLKNNF